MSKNNTANVFEDVNEKNDDYGEKPLWEEKNLIHKS
jgi:hypothetical protein